MKYGYGDIPKDTLIQNYELEDNKIVIIFLDGSNKKIPLTSENVLDLLDQMLKQAKDRDESLALIDAYQKKIIIF